MMAHTLINFRECAYVNVSGSKICDLLVIFRKLGIILLLIVAVNAQNAQNIEPYIEVAYGSNVFRSSIATNYSNIERVPEALDAIITPIIELSVFEDCMLHPEKYDIYDGEKTVETAPCFSNICSVRESWITGISMQPTIRDGSKINIRHDSQYNLSIGKIIAYDSLGQTKVYPHNTVHRIVGIEPEYGAKLVRNGAEYNILVPTISGSIIYYWKSDYFFTNISEPFYVVKGDNNDKISSCELVPKNAIHGVVVGV